MVRSIVIAVVAIIIVLLDDQRKVDVTNNNAPDGQWQWNDNKVNIRPYCEMEASIGWGSKDLGKAVRGSGLFESQQTWCQRWC